ncbi:hypothetical protein [Archangium sp.]|uniref:hypothetical protein n=1 Tax=Archangium sp. TaxID=1872627 RepID=UPI002D72AA4F|nr:hypothetical protein [Archangium sp.]HYO51994.1 hypothetical protein [Archangium sp.]
MRNIAQAMQVEVVLIDGSSMDAFLEDIRPVRAKNFVFLGSHNMQPPALRSNDEAMLRLYNKTEIYNAFLTHFMNAWNTGTDY